jgi:hypothetical protein
LISLAITLALFLIETADERKRRVWEDLYTVIGLHLKALVPGPNKMQKME